MTTLTPVQWRVLTYLQSDSKLRRSDVLVMMECGLRSYREVHEAMEYLSKQGLAELRFKRLNGRRMWFARSNERASGMVGVEVPVLEVAR